MLGLQTNVRNFSWTFGQNAPLSDYEQYQKCAIRMSLLMESDSAFSEVRRQCKDELWGKYHFVFGEPNAERVFYQRPLLSGMELYLEVSDLTGDQALIRANKNYFRYVRYRFMNLHSVSHVLSDLTTVLLLLKGFAPIHCSAFRIGERTILIFAPSNTGKTLITVSACLEQGADFIAEDVAITNGEQVYGVPWTSSFRYYENRMNPWTRLSQKAVRVFPLLTLLPIGKKQTINDYLPQERICHRSTVTDLVILERGMPYVGIASREAAFRKLQNLNRGVFNFQRSLINNAYEFFNPNFDISIAQETERSILRQIVNTCRGCFVIRAEDPTHYMDLVLRAITNMDPD